MPAPASASFLFGLFTRSINTTTSSPARSRQILPLPLPLLLLLTTIIILFLSSITNTTTATATATMPAFAARCALPLPNAADYTRFTGEVKTPKHEPDSAHNKRLALQAAALEYIRPDAHERIPIWADASQLCTNEHSQQPEGGAEGTPTAAAVVWRQDLGNGAWEWDEETKVAQPQHLPVTIRRAEMRAVLMALHKGLMLATCGGAQHKRVVAAYTDNLRVVDTIRGYRKRPANRRRRWGRDLLAQIVQINNAIRQEGVEVELRWIPRDNEIPGHQLADFAAKKAIGMWPPNPLADVFSYQQQDNLLSWYVIRDRDAERARRRWWNIRKFLLRSIFGESDNFTYSSALLPHLRWCLPPAQRRLPSSSSSSSSLPPVLLLLLLLTTDTSRDDGPLWLPLPTLTFSPFLRAGPHVKKPE